jgi:hypothetical protein
MNELYPNELISKVAESIDCGMICFINTETFEMEDVPREFIEDPEEFEALTGATEETMDLKHRQWEHVISIEPMDSDESFRIMEDFAQSMTDQRFQQQLIEAISHKKPFANFKQIIDHSEFRQDWFDFRQQYMESYVKEQLDFKFSGDDELDFEEINGFYDDDGNKIDPESVPLHGLCVICKKHHIEDWEENLLCLMNRYDQRDEPDFKCGAFENI